MIPIMPGAARRAHPRATALAPLLAVALSACPHPELASLDPCTVSGVNLETANDSVDEVDLLFMVDNSSSMAEEQVKLASKLSQLVLVLTSGDREAGKAAPRDYPERFFPKARSLHLGIVTSDLGRPPGTKAVGTCGVDGGGATGNGRLQNSTAQAERGIRNDVKGASVQLVPPDPSCAVQVPTYIDFGSEAAPYTDPRVAAAHFQCIAKVGIAGCGIEQQIAASYKALAPSTEQIFAGPDRGGKGDRENAGFLRPNSVLAVLMVSDEDDCSITDTPFGAAMFTEGTVNTHCQEEYKQNPSTPALHAVSTLAEKLVGLRGALPERFVFGAIVGLPVAASGVDYDDFRGLLVHPDMEMVVEKGDVRPVCTEQVDPSLPRPSNVLPGDAKPGRRFVELAQQIRDRKGAAVLRSICDADYTDALDQLIAKVAKQLKGPCLPRELPRDAAGLVSCSVVEILPLGGNASCAVPGRTDTLKRSLATDPPGSPEHLACTLAQLPFSAGGAIPTGAGWYYDQSTAQTLEECRGAPRILVTDTAPVRPGAVTRVECFRAAPRVLPDVYGRAAINTPCAPGPGCQRESDGRDLSLPTEPLVCDPDSKTCQVPCLTDADCDDGFLCGEKAPKICLNPSCSAG
jgi:hypothetical protein